MQHVNVLRQLYAMGFLFRRDPAKLAGITLALTLWAEHQTRPLYHPRELVEAIRRALSDTF